MSVSKSGIHAKIALVYFLIAALLGLWLRAWFVYDLPGEFKYVLHAHSHVALLGWVYVALVTLLYKLFVRSPATERGYSRVFWFTQIAIVGMLLSFPFQGYALYSIVFSTLFLFASYWFYGFFTKNTRPELKGGMALSCAKIALLYMVLSSIGPWTVGVVMNTLGTESIWYRMSIYFYLHFQYNGWMTMALVAVLIAVAERGGISLDRSRFRLFLWTFNAGVILSFFLSTLWAQPPAWAYVLGGLGAALQVFGFVVLVLGAGRWPFHGWFSARGLGALRVVSVLLAVKLTLQALTSLPYFADLAAVYRDFTIAYLHGTLLGVVSISVLVFLEFFHGITMPRWGYQLYLFAFFTTEVLIVYKGLALWLEFAMFPHYFAVLMGLSALFPLALAGWLTANMRRVEEMRSA